MSEITEKQPRERSESPMLRRLMEMVDNDERGPLAELRRGAGDFPNYGERVLRHVAQFLGSDDAKWRTDASDDAKLLIATLFALNPTDHDGPGNLGDTMRAVGIARGGIEAVERRFLALLGARSEAIATHLRHAVGLAEATRIPVGWNQLLRDVEDLLTDTDWRRQRVVEAWSRSFWRKIEADAPEAAES